jgi:curli production assembly/transport component CsgF
MCVAGVLGLSAPAFATEQVYHPISPALGGNPNNGSFLLSTAQSQGEGTKSGNQGPDLSGLTNALSGLGSSTSQTVANPTTTQTKQP